MPARADMLEQLKQPGQTDDQPDYAPPMMGIADAEERPDRHKGSKPLPVGGRCRDGSEFNRGKGDDSNG